MADSPIIIVTGGNRGIGFEICRQLAARGAQVILTARDTKAGLAAVRKLNSPRGPQRAVGFHPLAVDDDASVAALGGALEKFGRCDVLINNAGMIAGDDNSILSVAPDSVQSTLATNTIAPLHVTQALLPFLRKSDRGGRVVNVSSGAGELADPFGSWSPAYSLSKAALNLVTRMLAAALEPEGIAVNAMCPGWVRTKMGGENAPRDVAQGADTAVWLALDASANLTGKFFRDRKVIPW